MEGIKCVNMIEIDPVVIEIRGVENGKLVVPVNNIHSYLGATRVSWLLTHNCVP